MAKKKKSLAIELIPVEFRPQLAELLDGKEDWELDSILVKKIRDVYPEFTLVSEADKEVEKTAENEIAQSNVLLSSAPTELPVTELVQKVSAPLSDATSSEFIKRTAKNGAIRNVFVPNKGKTPKTTPVVSPPTSAGIKNIKSIPSDRSGVYIDPSRPVKNA